MLVWYNVEKGNGMTYAQKHNITKKIRSQYRSFLC